MQVVLRSPFWRSFAVQVRNDTRAASYPSLTAARRDSVSAGIANHSVTRCVLPMTVGRGMAEGLEGVISVSVSVSSRVKV